MSHRIFVGKLRGVDINPYIINSLTSFFRNRMHRVVVDNITTEYLDITKGVPQGLVLGPMDLDLMVLGDGTRSNIVFSDDKLYKAG